MHIVLIAVVMDFSGLVLAEAVLSYIGIGVDPSTISFGTMINTARLELAREPVVWWSLVRRLRVHVRAGAGGQPVRRCGARCLRSAPDCRRIAHSAQDKRHEPAARRIPAHFPGKPGGRRARGRRRVLRRSAGETFALLGESGCGKSMTALSLMRLLPDAGTIVGGRVLLEKRDLLALPEAEMRAVRGRGMAMIFQEPATSLNPVLTSASRSARCSRATPRCAARRRGAGRRTARGRRHSRRGAALDEYPSSFPAA
jgi:hypothetical protein